MKKLRFIVLAAALALAGCGEREPENRPVTQVNAPRPTNIVTNLPPAK